MALYKRFELRYSGPLADPQTAERLQKKQDEARRIAPPLKETPKIIKSMLRRLQ